MYSLQIVNIRLSYYIVSDLIVKQL